MKKLSIGIIGAGRVGTAMARQALKAGYTVYISNSRGPNSLALMVDVLMPGAIAVSAEEAASRGDIVYLALPLSKYRSMPAKNMAGKIVIDAMNYWSIGEGAIAEFENNPQTTSEIVQAFLPDSKVVKTLNHIGYHELEEEGLPEETPGRRALVLAGDFPDAKTVVAQLISDLGFDTYDAGSLSEGWRFGPDTPVFGGRYKLTELQEALSKADLYSAVSAKS